MFTVIWNQPGCLPEMEPYEVETATEGWDGIITDMETNYDEFMWEVDDEEDPDGPQHRTAFALDLERASLGSLTGCIAGPDGYNYSVEVTEP